MRTVLTLSEARTRDALEAVSVPMLETFKERLAEQIKALVKAEYGKTEFAWIADPDYTVLNDYLTQGLDDCFYNVECEVKS
jgi:hypothetical protein